MCKQCELIAFFCVLPRHLLAITHKHVQLCIYIYIYRITPSCITRNITEYLRRFAYCAHLSRNYYYHIHAIKYTTNTTQNMQNIFGSVFLLRDMRVCATRMFWSRPLFTFKFSIKLTKFHINTSTYISSYNILYTSSRFSDAQYHFLSIALNKTNYAGNFLTSLLTNHYTKLLANHVKLEQKL